jgi:NADH:ubiquinone oxidoreductase subunit 6 (subunit J)
MSAPTSNERLVAALVHLCVLAGLAVIVPAIVFLVQRGKSVFIAGHALLALAVQSTVFVLMLLAMTGLHFYVGSQAPRSGGFDGLAALGDYVFGMFLCMGPLVGLSLLAAIVCAVQAARGRWFTGPI